MKLGKVNFTHTCTNQSERYILVVNCADFISDHATLEEAAEACSKISIGESKWAVIRILGPGESATLDLERRIYPQMKYSEADFEL